MPQWQRIAMLIGWIGNDDVCAKAILDYVRTPEGWDLNVDHVRVILKGETVMWAGRIWRQGHVRCAAAGSDCGGRAGTDQGMDSRAAAGLGQGKDQPHGPCGWVTPQWVWSWLGIPKG